MFDEQENPAMNWLTNLWEIYGFSLYGLGSSKKQKE